MLNFQGANDLKKVICKGQRVLSQALRYLTRTYCIVYVIMYTTSCKVLSDYDTKRVRNLKKFQTFFI